VKMSIKVLSPADTAAKQTEICPPLTRQLQKHGFVLEDDVFIADCLIAINHDPKAIRDFLRAGGTIENAILIRLEPAAVFPVQYRSRIERKYGKIFTPGSTKVNKNSILAWPYYYNSNPLRPDKNHLELRTITSRLKDADTYDSNKWGNRRFLLTLIASNKVSAISSSNYQLRRELAQSLPKNFLTVYGGLWDSSLFERIKHRVSVLKSATWSGVVPNLFQIYGNLFRKYQTTAGIIEDKHQIIQESKFSLVIENDSNYVSEKLVDALLGGSIPIYVGGDFSALTIPKEAVVTGISDAQDLVSFVASITDDEVLRYLSSAQQWLASPDFYEVWSGDKVYSRIADEINHYLGTVIE
jgi:hypothetical protein